ncbi:hypothetical protein AB0E63_38575 [Kribbella sp. NPDC026596]|uniref:hypothetical protein n=1 Tax=Kribbella sp. NPDC026596 TaxID=3155122 RepID=UPI0033CA8AD1
MVVERLVDHYHRTHADDLSWMYGQGSVITGLADESDLDLILIWNTDVPSAPTLPGQSNVTVHGRLALEQSNVDGYDVDLMHVPRRTFENWISELERGDGWAGAAWPLPVYVAAGLAESELLLDQTGVGTEYRSRVQIPAAPLVAKVRHQLEIAVPGFIKELSRAADRDNRWLHADLAVQLHKLVYTAWFLFEGHYPPFPKYLPQWYERFGMDREIQRLEATFWAARDPAESTAALESLAAAVLNLTLAFPHDPNCQ